MELGCPKQQLHPPNFSRKVFSVYLLPEARSHEPSYLEIKDSGLVREVSSVAQLAHFHYCKPEASSHLSTPVQVVILPI